MIFSHFPNRRGLTLLSLLLLSACTTLPGPESPAPLSGDEEPPVVEKLSQLMERFSSQQAVYPRSRDPGGFYVALQATPEWLPDSRSDCMDDTLFASLRRMIKPEAMQLTLVVNIRTSANRDAIRVPLFVMGKNEQPAAGEPTCFSEVTDRKLTPVIRADRDSEFQLDFEIYTSKSADFRVAEQLLSLGGDVLNLAGGSGWLLEKLADDRLQAAGRRLDEALATSWQSSSRDVYHTTLQVFPDTADWHGYTDALRFNLGRISAGAQGMQLAGGIPTSTVKMVYRDSLLGSGDRYSKDPAALLSAGMGSSDFTLNSLLGKGINNVTAEYLRNATDPVQMESYCRSLRTEFGRYLTPRDALVARYSAVKVHSHYDLGSELRNPTCFTDAELAELAGLGFTFRPVQTRRDPSDRSAKVAALLEPLRKAMRAADSAQIETRIQALFSDTDVETLRLEVWDAEVLPAREGGWHAGGSEVIDRLMEMAALQPLIGCYQAPADTDLSLLGLVVRLAGKPAGWVVSFSNGQPQEILIGSITKIRQFARLPETWVTGCQLL